MLSFFCCCQFLFEKYNFISFLSDCFSSFFFFMTNSLKFISYKRTWPLNLLPRPKRSFCHLACITHQNKRLQSDNKMNFQGLLTDIWPTTATPYLDRVKRIWFLSPMRAAKVQASLRIRAVSPEPSLLAHTSSESRGTFRQKARSLAPLNGWACAVKICHDGMLEDTNSLDAAHLVLWIIYKIFIKIN